jgi:hypothetical protein
MHPARGFFGLRFLQFSIISAGVVRGDLCDCNRVGAPNEADLLRKEISGTKCARSLGPAACRADNPFVNRTQMLTPYPSTEVAWVGPMGLAGIVLLHELARGEPVTSLA